MASHEDTEIRDRVRRIETRVTSLANQLGIDVVGRPSIIWNDQANRLQVSTPNCALAEILREIPAHLSGERVKVYLGCEYIATVFSDIAEVPLRARSIPADHGGTHAHQ